MKQEGDEPVFKLREVELGPKLGDAFVVLGGLSAGEEIVSQGAFSVDAAAQLEGKPSMMNLTGGDVQSGHDHDGMSGERNEQKMENDSETPHMEHQMIRVAGNCEMCKDRIEMAAKSVAGVVSADWNQETNKLEVTFDDSKTNADKIEMAVAKVGHDTPHHKAADDVYNKLPGCCKYDRGSAKNEGPTQHQH